MQQLLLTLLLVCLQTQEQYLTPCIDWEDTISFPCTLNGVVYACADIKAIGQGSFGTVFKVSKYDLVNGSFDSKIFAMKFSEISPENQLVHGLDEIEVTERMMGIVEMSYQQNLEWIASPLLRSLNVVPTIKIYNSESKITKSNCKRFVMVTDFYSNGDVWNIQKLSRSTYENMVQHRDEYVFKLLVDISFVLQMMWDIT